MTDWVITGTALFSNMDGLGTAYGEADTLTGNSGCRTTCDLAVWAGNDGSIDSNAITMNANAILYITPKASGTGYLDLNSGVALTVAEGGQLLSLGTAGARVAIRGEDNSAVGAHRILLVSGGKFYSQYTDISMLRYACFISGGGTYHAFNTTMSNIGSEPIHQSNGQGDVLLVNCTIAAPSGLRVLRGLYDLSVTAINTAFTSVTDNLLVLSGFSAHITFAGCTYQGIPIIMSDINDVAFDIDIRIYEASVVPVVDGGAAALAAATVGLTHPSLQSDGMFLDNTTMYQRIPAYLAYPVTDAAGQSKIYTLQKSAYWPSGLAVASRTWKYWSDSGQTETGDNQKFTFTASKVGYVTAAATAWAGANPSAITLEAIISPIRFDGGTF